MWKIGDRAILVNDGTIRERDILRLINSVVELSCPCAAIGYDWDITTDIGLLEARESCLKPLPDANEKTTWSECIFKPKVLERVE